MRPRTIASRLKLVLGAVSIIALVAFSPFGLRSAFAHDGRGNGGNGGGGGWGGGGNGGGWGGGGNGGSGGNGGGRGGGGNGGGPYQAPELDATTAAQGLVLIGGALVLVRRYRRES